MFEQGKAEASIWADDARLTNLSLFLDILEDKTKLRMQFYFVSDWKQEALITYTGDLFSTIYDEETYFNFKQYNQKVFFLMYPNWSKAVLKAHDLISDKVKGELHLHISEVDDNSLSINFRYHSGKVSMLDKFTF